MLTSRGKYGLKAMLYLARVPVGEHAQVADIAARNTISKKFLDAILLDLQHAGFVRSRKGPGGGYTLSRPPGEITVGAVVRALNGSLAPLACADPATYAPCPDCSCPASCAVRLIMTDVGTAISDILDGTTLASLAARGQAAEAGWYYAI